MVKRLPVRFYPAASTFDHFLVERLFFLNLELPPFCAGGLPRSGPFIYCISGGPWMPDGYGKKRGGRMYAAG
jgi:hypothetical protein